MGNGDYRGISNEPPPGYWADTIAAEEREPAEHPQDDGMLRSPELETHIECPNQCGDTLILLPQDGVLWCHRCMEEFEVRLTVHRGY